MICIKLQLYSLRNSIKKIGYPQKTSECISMDSSNNLGFLDIKKEKYINDHHPYTLSSSPGLTG